jgi:uncharacterized protein YjaG (DUF416 family)
MAIKEIEELKPLDFTKQATFAYLTCERLYPNYVYFSANFSFGEPRILRKAIDYLYQVILVGNPDKATVTQLLESVEKNTPDTEDFSTPLVSSALDACTATLDSLHFLIDMDFQRIEAVSSYATDTASMYIQDKEELDYNSDKNFQSKIDSHPLMKKEIEIQSGIITFLYGTKKIDSEDIKTLLLLQEIDKKGSVVPE